MFILFILLNFYNINLSKSGKVIKENRVVIKIITAEYSFSLSNFSAKIDVIAAAGIAVIIVNVLTTIELSFIIFEIIIKTTGNTSNFKILL